jgi:hypothetical protein
MEESGTVTDEVESDIDRVIVENRTSTPPQADAPMDVVKSF